MTAELDGAAVLDEVHRFLGKYVAFPSAHARVAVTLWAAHAHMVHEFESTPRLAVLSPEPGSGKSRVLEVLDLLVPRPQQVLNASPAAVFRMIESDKPTLLLDEVDAVFGRNGKSDDGAEDLRALLNAGYRSSATIPRCVGPTHSVQHFPVFAAVALAGLGYLPETLMTRSVVVRMRRRAPNEKVEQFRRRLVTTPGHVLRDRLAAWAKSVAGWCGEAFPDMPKGITDRPADVWEPLLAVADAAGGTWPNLARLACVALNAGDDDGATSLGVRLLADLRAVFGQAPPETDKDGEPIPPAYDPVEDLHTADLLERLHKLDEAPWGDLKGKPLDALFLSKLLRQYGVASKQMRIKGYSAKGYSAATLRDTWKRYLSDPGGPPETGETPETSLLTPVSGTAAVSGRPETASGGETPGHAA